MNEERSKEERGGEKDIENEPRKEWEREREKRERSKGERDRGREEGRKGGDRVGGKENPSPLLSCFFYEVKFRESKTGQAKYFEHIVVAENNTMQKVYID